MKTVLLLAMSATAALCQQAQISGLIQDPAGLSIMGAAISVRSEETGAQRLTQSNQAGFYGVTSLRPGTYRVTIRATGFETIEEGVKLEVGDGARLDFVMRIGDSRTVVTVRGGPPLMNTEDASVGTVIGRDLIDQMPLNGRGIQTLVELTPGSEAVPSIATNSGQFSVNGQRSDANYFTVDGLSANFAAGAVESENGGGSTIINQAGGGTLPANNLLGTFSNLVSPDALQEFRLQTSTFAPEFGRAPGAQIGFVTRSGTTRYSGTLFEYVRNDIFDANNWFSDQLGQPKSPLRFNNFGASLGGPLKIPRVLEHLNQTFFFFSFEDLLMRQPQPLTPFLVPDQQTRMSASPLVASLYDALPLPTLPNVPAYVVPTPGFGGYVQGVSAPTDQQTWGLRLDHYFSDKLIGFLRYNRSPSNVTVYPSGLPVTKYQFVANTGMLTFGLTLAASATLVNDIRLGFSSQNVSSGTAFVAYNGAREPLNAELFPPGSSPQNSAVSVNDLEFPAIPSIEEGPFLQNHSNQFQVVDKLSWVHGAHQWKFGVDYRLFRLRLGGPKTDTVYDFSNLSSGIASEVEESGSPADITYHVSDFSLYAQDTWHASPSLTVTYGLRWELDPAPRTSGGQAFFYPELTLQQLTSHAIFTPATSGTPFYRTQYGAVAPRLGVAWQVHDGAIGKTVLRLGTGVFYDSGQSSFASGTSGYFSSYSNVPFGTYPTGQTPALESSFYTLALSSYALPRTYQWNVTVEQSFGQQTFSAGYVGAIGRRLTGEVNGASNTSPDLKPPANTFILGDMFSSSYNSLQLQFDRKLNSRIQALVSYTWSHSIDNLSSEEGNPDTNIAFFEYKNLNRGPSDFDIRHSLHGALLANLPAPHSGPAAALFRNWTASSIFFAQSALPLDILIHDDGTFVRPNVVPGQPLYLYGSGYPGGKRFNPAAFTPPPTGALEGDLGRNVLRGFGAWQDDLALHRQFRLTEHTSLQFRAEAFNVLNHPNFAPGNGAYDSVVGSSTFGLSQINFASALSSRGTLGELSPLFQVGNARILQLALRLTF